VLIRRGTCGFDRSYKNEEEKNAESLLVELHGRSTLVLEQGVGRQLAVLEFWEQASSSAARSGKDAASCSCWEKLNQRHVMTSRR